MKSVETPPQKIAIVGAGFTGVAMAAALHRYANQPLEIILFEKTGLFGAGDAYRTPYFWHLLNAYANTMSAFEDDPDHFVQWLECHAAVHLDQDVPHGRQFMPRVLYHQYLCSLLATIFQDEASGVKLTLVPEEVVDIEVMYGSAVLTLANEEKVIVEQVVLAHGNNTPAPLPVKLDPRMNYIANPWNYTALEEIPATDPVMIVGTGLSMVDAVLTLHNQHHQGKIYAISRRGLIPLPHKDTSQACVFDVKSLPGNLREMVKVVRAEAEKLALHGGDWRSIIQQMRLHLPELWQRMSTSCKQRFLRHVLPYWNIHRHRVHEKIHGVLSQLRKNGQLEIMAGYLRKVGERHVSVRLRNTSHECVIPVKHIINCIGSGNDAISSEQPLLLHLNERGDVVKDDLQLGLGVTSQFSLKTKDGTALPCVYTLGPPLRGEIWETIAVPEIRKQCKALAGILLSNEIVGLNQQQSHA